MRFARRAPLMLEQIPFESTRSSAHSRASGNPGPPAEIRNLGPRFRGDERMPHGYQRRDLGALPLRLLGLLPPPLWGRVGEGVVRQEFDGATTKESRHPHP